MVAVSTILRPTGTQTLRVRTAVAEATANAQTDWVAVPQWCTNIKAIFNCTAVSGTTPQFRPTLYELFPTINNDSFVQRLGNTVITGGITSTGTVICEAGPGVTGIANAATAVATSGVTYLKTNCVVPAILGCRMINDRADGDELYTYTIDVIFKGSNR